MKKKKLTLVKDAKYKMKQSIKLSKKTEHIKIEKSEGRILSKNIIANFNIPEEDNSAVDGYAINLKNNERLFNCWGVKTR